jgi:hypothetical protein
MTGRHGKRQAVRPYSTSATRSMSATRPPWAARTWRQAGTRVQTGEVRAAGFGRAATHRRSVGDLVRGLPGEDPGWPRGRPGEAGQSDFSKRRRPSAGPPRDEPGCHARSRWQAISSPRRKRTCWLRVSRPTRQQSSTAARPRRPARRSRRRRAGCGRAARHLASPCRVVAPPGLEVLLPAVPGDGHLHDLGGALVDRRDPHVALDLLHDVGRV